MTHTFIVNTENVNEYGYRILTDGVDYKQFMRNPVVLFMHDRYNSKDRGSEVIGRVVKMYKNGTELIADIEFDENDPFAKKIADKVAGGFIRMASMSADVKATSTDTELVLAGQTLETVTKCKLVEISIVDIGGNDDALKLSKDGQPIQLQKINQKKESMSQFKTVALALGIVADATEDTVVGKVQEMKLAKENAEKEVSELKVKLSAITTSEATALVEKAITLGLFPEVLKDSQLKSFEADFDGQKAVLSKLITDKEAESAINGNHNAVKNVVLAAKGSTATSPEMGENSFDYLQKHNVVELTRLRDHEPTKYAQLAKEYGQGVRYSK
jgi:Caudovirus prohead serine protease